MKLNDIMNNFQVDRIREIRNQGTLYEMHHIVNGAQLVYLKSDDANKLFSVAFKTIPEDDTGVFHILEHSVLCGSEKYPVKEPFVELLKSSMNTFLNAMTYPDKTVYPVSSKNDKDFMNLMNVYLDAVFKPAIYHNKHIFMQEGWHYELRDKGDAPIYKGVVFNEMKGATSSLESMIDHEMMRMLYPDTCYQYVSGGDPAAIPSLSYEAFLANHKKYYHPGNAIFYLEGNMDIAASLALIASYIDAYDAMSSRMTIAMQAPVPNVEKVAYYGISEDESLEEKTQFVYGKIVGDYSEKHKMYAISLISDYLTGSNDAPLKKAIISQGFGQDAHTILTDGIQQAYFTVYVGNTEAKHREAIKQTVRDTVQTILSQGLDKTMLEASLNALEFALRDASEPKALMHNMQVLNAMLYGGDPMTYLSFDEMFSFLREQLTTDYYEKLLAELFDESQGMATLTMMPSYTYNQELEEAEEKRLEAISSTWDDAEKEAVIAANATLDHWQQTPDHEDALATIPKLKLSDINSAYEKVPVQMTEEMGVPVNVYPSTIPGITHINLYFKMDVIDEQQLLAISFLTNFLGDLPTHRSLTSLLYDIKANTGRLYFDMIASSRPGAYEQADFYLVVRTSVLTSKVKDALRLIKEIIFETSLRQEEEMLQLLTQILDEFRNDIIMAGQRYATRRVVAAFSQEALINEHTDGLTCYLYLQDLVRHFDERKDAFMTYLEEARDVLSADRLTISVTTPEYTDDIKETFVKPLIACFQKPATPVISQPLFYHRQPLGCEIPSGISYACIGTNLYHASFAYHGGWAVLSTLLSYYYLWNEVRVKGGAYGTGFATGMTGNLCFTSYRDPDIARSLEIYRQTPTFIRQFADSDENLEQYIISTIARSEPLKTPRSAADLMMGYYLRGITYEDLCQIRADILHITKDDLRQFADMLEECMKLSTLCIIGHHEEMIHNAKENLDIMNLGS